MMIDMNDNNIGDDLMTLVLIIMALLVLVWPISFILR